MNEVGFMFIKLRAVALGSLAVIFTTVVCAQSNPHPASRAERVDSLSQELQWRDESGKQKYGRGKTEVTEALFNEIDGFVVESLSSSHPKPAQVKAALDGLLGRNPKKAISSNTAFVVTLPSGRFLIVGLELWRGGEAINEDAISFRAYRIRGGRLAFVAATELLHSSDPGNPYLVGLSAKALDRPPVESEFWLFGTAEVPPQSPRRVVIRLYAFNGETFRTIWAPRDVVAKSADSAITITSDGFRLERLSDPTGQAAGSPTEIIKEQYAITLDGPAKVAESYEPRQ